MFYNLPLFFSKRRVCPARQSPQITMPRLQNTNPPGILLLIFFSLITVRQESVFAMDVNRIVAVVNDGVILESELSRQIDIIKTNLSASGTQLPPETIIQRQVLERMIINKLQLQQAERAGMNVDDQMLQRSMARLAQQNNMSPEDFRNAVRAEGMDYGRFMEDMRNELIMNQLRSQMIASRIKISDQEVDHFLQTRGKAGTNRNIQYHLGHILIATPEAASPTQIQQSQQRAHEILSELRGGKNFKEMAVSVSDGSQGLKGGDLGWRRLGEIPTLFVGVVPDMEDGELAGPIQSASGFHIIQLIERKGAGKHVIFQTKVQHILLKTSDLFSDEDARSKLLVLKQRIEDGDEFSAIAQAHSDDTSSALKGGDLDWVNPGALVPNFEQAMNKLEPGQISDPVQTQFGWHLIRVLDRAERDNTEEYKKELARQEIRKQKIEEETELWLRQLRNEAYVEIRLGNS